MLPKGENSLNNVKKSLKANKVKHRIVEQPAELFDEYKKQIFKEDNSYSWYYLNDATPAEVREIIEALI